MNAQLLRDPDALEALRGEWNELLQRSFADSVFLSWEWCRTWRQTLGRNVEPFIVTVRDGQGRLVALAPLYRTRARLVGVISYRCLCVLGDRGSGSEYPDVIIDPECTSEAEEAIRECLQRHGREWDCIWAPRIAGWTGALPRFRRCCADGAAVQIRQRTFSAVELPATPEAYWQSLSGNMRSTLRRQRRHIETRFEKHFAVLTRGEEIIEHLDAFVRLHQQRWSAAGDPGAFGRHPGLRSFYAALCREMDTTGWLRMFCLGLDGRTVAVQFGLVYGQTYHQLQEGFDPQVAPGIGNVLRLESIEQCMREGLKSYDFLGGFSEHKRRWGACTRTGYDLFIHQRHLRTIPLRAREVWPTGRFIRFEQPEVAPPEPTPVASRS